MQLQCMWCSLLPPSFLNSILTLLHCYFVGILTLVPSRLHCLYAVIGSRSESVFTDNGTVSVSPPRTFGGLSSLHTHSVFALMLRSLAYYSASSFLHCYCSSSLIATTNHPPSACLWLATKHILFRVQGLGNPNALCNVETVVQPPCI